LTAILQKLPAADAQDKITRLHSPWLLGVARQLRPGNMGAQRILSKGIMSLVSCIGPLESMQVGFQEVFQSGPTPVTALYVAARVAPSMRADTPRLAEVWVTSARLAACRCSCPLGFTGCQHVLSVLLRIERSTLLPWDRSLAFSVVQRLVASEEVEEDAALLDAFFARNDSRRPSELSTPTQRAPAGPAAAPAEEHFFASGAQAITPEEILRKSALVSLPT
jgi:hypothetical protein